MQPCHTTPFVQPGVVIEPRPANAEPDDRLRAPTECCDYCGSARLEWRKCKLVCADCRHINKSCADL